MALKTILIENTLKLTLLFTIFLNVESSPKGYGNYDYHGHGHDGYNEIGTINKVVDYHSYPEYAFGYEVEDYYTQLSHGRWEVRNGDVTQGQYRVLLPDGRIQIVSYIADKGGYRPTIEYIGKGAHPPPPPPFAHIKAPKGIPDPYLEKRIEIPIGNEIYGQSPHHHGHGHLNLFDQLNYGPSETEEVKISPDAVLKKQALLYDKTLFRRDIPKKLFKRQRRVRE